MDKTILRREARARRNAFGAALLPVPAQFSAMLVRSGTLASYVATGGEADPAPLVRVAAAAGWRIALPHVVDRETPLRFLAWDEELMLQEGPFGLRQPDSAAPALTPDIILTPLVAFDAALNRLGQGAGHYDRAFAEFPDSFRIGIAYSVQQCARIPADPWDVPLDAIITEQGWRAR